MEMKNGKMIQMSNGMDKINKKALRELMKLIRN